MGQLGLFDVEKRYAGLDAKNDPLLRIDAVVPWEGFPVLSTAYPCRSRIRCRSSRPARESPPAPG